MRRLLCVSTLALSIATAANAHAEDAWFRLGPSSGAGIGAVEVPDVGTNNPDDEDGLNVGLGDVDTLRVGSAAFIPVTITGNPTSIVVSGVPGLSYDVAARAVTGVPTTPSASATLVITIGDSTSSTFAQTTVLVADELSTPPLAGPSTIVYDPYDPISIIVGDPGTVGDATWTGIGLPSGLVVDSTTGAVTGSPPSTPGNYTFELEVTDGWDGSKVRTSPITITVPTQSALLTLRAKGWADVLVAAFAAMRKMDQLGVGLVQVAPWMYENNRVPAAAEYRGGNIYGRPSPYDSTSIKLIASVVNARRFGFDRYFTRVECLELLDQLTGRLPDAIMTPMMCSPNTTMLLFSDPD